MNNKIWVQIERNKGCTNGVWTLWGQILESELNDWLNGVFTKQCFKLENTYWINERDIECEGKTKKLLSYTITGQSFCNPLYENFTGVYYLTAQHIVCIAILKNNKNVQEIKTKKSCCACYYTCSHCDPDVIPNCKVNETTKH